MSDALVWRCRRGLLELDLWLGGFLQAHRATLQPCEAAALEQLLSLSDMEIVDRLQGRTPTVDIDLAALIERLGQYRAATILESR